MSWLNEYVRPKIRTLFSRREVPDNLWVKCPDTGQMVFHKEVEGNHWVIPGSEHHLKMSAVARLKMMFDEGTWIDVPLPEVAVDPLKFRDEKRYADRLKEARAKTGMQDAFKVGFGRVGGQPMTLACQDFAFMGGSLGMAAGEAFIRGAETALEKRTPYVLFAASGGARMQEGILSLMQMPRTTIAARLVKEAGLPFITVLTDPTTGGVTASFAMLGDLQIAEPGALIGFAGSRVIEQTVRETLPDGFQRAEYLHAHGILDMVVPRPEMRGTLARLIGLLRVPVEVPAEPEPPQPLPEPAAA